MGVMLPGELVWLLDELGYSWPAADEEALFRLGQHWLQLAPHVDAAVADARAAVTELLGATSGPAVEAFAAAWSADDAPLTSLSDARAGVQAMGPLLMLAAGVVLALKVNVIVQLALLAVEIAQAIATSPVTFGASLAEIPVFKIVTGKLLDLLIDQAIGQILG